VIAELAIAGLLMDRLSRRGFDRTKTRRAFPVLSMVGALGVVVLGRIEQIPEPSSSLARQ